MQARVLELCLDVDFEHADFSVYHILEALDKDLGQEITERKTDRRVLSKAEVMQFLVQTSHALAYAHSEGIALRDIKPDNIFLDREKVFKVGDFGTSMLAIIATGTVSYRSP